MTGGTVEGTVEGVVREVADGICTITITIDRPEAGNALTQAIRDQIGAWYATPRPTSSCGPWSSPGPATVPSAPEPTCGAGVTPPTRPDDAPETAMGDGSRMIRDGWQLLITSILDCEKPVVAGVNGTAAGGGMHLRSPATWS